MKALITFILMIAPTFILAQDDFRKFNINNLCDLVDGRQEDPDPDSKFVYLYQKRLSEAAGITKNDSEPISITKMQAFWRRWGHEMTCDDRKFDTPNASIIKFAIRSQFTEFFDDVVNNWQLDLNVVDPVDGRTILDYVEHQISKNTGTEIEKILVDYRRILIKKGAKRSKELAKP